MSADFAIQNVSTHMGIKLLAFDGRVISAIRRFIW
jgi:rRNA maturation endonuclease Nob1